jgi:hypothetical protein
MSAHDGSVTANEGRPGGWPSPPDPEAYDSPRAERARAKGLKAPYITGGTAPDAVEARAEERRLGRMLVIMVVTIVAAGFVIGAIVALLMPAGQ